MTIAIGGENTITSMITFDAVNDLTLTKGNKVIALTKDGRVAIGK